MLYTCHSSRTHLAEGMRNYHITSGQGNNAVAPDAYDLQDYRQGIITWEGFQLNYLSILMRPLALEWMEGVATEASRTDVVLVDDEPEVVHAPRRYLAEMIMNMFSGRMSVGYGGELT